MGQDPEAIRELYNETYRQRRDHASCQTFLRARRIVGRALRDLRRLGVCPKQGSKVLDVGCARGYIAEFLRRCGFEVYGLDYSDVAIEIATANFPKCRFIHMDGLDPHLDTAFDMVFCRGFSGANTHDLSFVGSWINKYIALLNPGGVFVLSFATDGTGRETQANETVNWSLEEIQRLGERVEAQQLGIFFHPTKWELLTRLNAWFRMRILRKKYKETFYIVYQR